MTPQSINPPTTPPVPDPNFVPFDDEPSQWDPGTGDAAVDTMM